MTTVGLGAPSDTRRPGELARMLGLGVRVLLLSPWDSRIYANAGGAARQARIRWRSHECRAPDGIAARATWTATMGIAVG